MSVLITTLVCLTGSVHAAAIDFSDTIRKTTEFINRTIDDKNIMGLSIALVSEEQMVWAAGFGMADNEKKVPAHADTAYMLGSGSKTLTSVALLMPKDPLSIDLKRPVTDYLKEFSLLPRYTGQMQAITVERLLNHHSGLPGDIYNGGFVALSWNQWGCDLYYDWLMNYLAGAYLSYAPGELAIYSNTGFVLSGEIALRTGGNPGEDFNDFMVRTLFKPLQMNRTNFRAAIGDMAVGYADGKPQPRMETNCVFGATGGAVTTVLDMSRFLAMILNNGRGPNGIQILTPESTALLGRSEVTPLDYNSYFIPGIGLDTVSDPVMRYAGRAWAKNGSTGDFNSYMELLPDVKLAVIVLANSDTAGMAVYTVARECLKNAVAEKTGLQPSLPPFPELPSWDDPEHIAGVYVKKNGFDLIKNDSGDTLSWVIDAHTGTTNTHTLSYNRQDQSWQAGGLTQSLVFQKPTYMGTEHFVMIQKGSSGSDLDKSVYGGYVVAIQGERLPVPAITAAWQSRAGQKWVVENIPFNDFSWDQPFPQIEISGGLLMVRQGDAAQVIFPSTDNLAFVQGLGNRNGSAVQIRSVEGRETMVFAGWESYPISLVPVVHSGDVVKNTLAFHKTHWYRFDALKPGVNVVFDIPGGAGGYRLRLFNSDLSTMVAQGTDRIAHTDVAGSNYLAVSRAPDAPPNYSLLVNP